MKDERIVLAVVAALVLALATPGSADVKYKTVILSQPDSPVLITACESWARDFAVSKLLHATVPNYMADLGLQFTNRSAKTIKVIQFDFTSYDAFGAPLTKTQSGTVISPYLDTTSNATSRDKTFAPGQSFDLLGPRSWQGRNAFPGRDHTSCSVSKVLFDDGTMWSSPTPSPAPSPS